MLLASFLHMLEMIFKKNVYFRVEEFIAVLISHRYTNVVYFQIKILHINANYSRKVISNTSHRPVLKQKYRVCKQKSRVSVMVNRWSCKNIFLSKT